MAGQRGHSRWAPSASGRWMNCPASLRMVEALGLPDTESEYAREGTMLHTLSERALRQGYPAAHWLGETIDGYLIDLDYADVAQQYVDVPTRDWLLYGGTLLIEQAFELHELWPAGLWGRNDAALLSADCWRVYDLKGGAGVVVNVEGNTQLSIYGLGLVRSYPQLYQRQPIELVVCQPRAPHRDGPVRRWRMTADQLDAFEVRLLDALQSTMDPQAALHAGDHCRFCPARQACPAVKDLALRQAQLDYAPAPPQASLLSVEQLVELLPKVELVELFIKDVRARALALAEAGTAIPGWHLAAKRAVRKWKVGDDEVRAALAGRIDEADMHEPLALKSPAQMEKLLARADRGVIETLIDRVSSGHTLVADMDPREAQEPQYMLDYQPVNPIT